MSDDCYYLKKNIFCEPLVNNWYAWSYLFQPVTLSRYITQTHLRLMRSFVSNAELHAIASKDPLLSGGEFLGCDEGRVDQVLELLNTIENDCSDLIRLSKCIDEIDALVLSHTSGESIEYLYSLIPKELKGYIEVVIDRDLRASYRLLESLLYKSELNNIAKQSMLFGQVDNENPRPFVLSTPRLPGEGNMIFEVDLCSPILDDIFSSRETPISKDKILEFNDMVGEENGLDVFDLFTEQKPVSYLEKYNNGVNVRYAGHAGFLIEAKGVSILIDPVIGIRGDADTEKEMLGYSELPSKIDVICITHNHLDHLNIETLLQLRYKTELVLVPRNNAGTIVDPSMKLLLKHLKFNVIEVDDLESHSIPGGVITSIPFLGEHGDLDIRSKTAWLVELEGKKLFFGADSANPEIALYKHIKELLSDLDLFAIGMECVGAPYTWVYGALSSRKISKKIKESRRLNGSDAKQASELVSLLKPKAVAIYALGIEECFNYFMGINYSSDSKQIVESEKFIALCKELGIEAEMLSYNKEYNFV